MGDLVNSRMTLFGDQALLSPAGPSGRLGPASHMGSGCRSWGEDGVSTVPVAGGSG
jgi:hypothetical protein